MSDQTITLSKEALAFIEGMRDDDNTGLVMQIEVVEDLIIDLIRDNEMGNENNRRYLMHLADVLVLTRLLLHS